MGIWLHLLWTAFRNLVRSRRRLTTEILLLRHQLNVATRRRKRRIRFTGTDRALFVWLYRRCPEALSAVVMVRPETVVRWHRMGFRAYWRWKSRKLRGRPRIDRELRDLIRRMSGNNVSPLRVHARHLRKRLSNRKGKLAKREADVMQNVMCALIQEGADKLPIC